MGGLPLLLLLKLVAFGVYMEEDLRHPPVPQSYFSSSASRLAIAAASSAVLRITLLDVVLAFLGLPNTVQFFPLWIIFFP